MGFAHRVRDLDLRQGRMSGVAMVGQWHGKSGIGSGTMGLWKNSGSDLTYVRRGHGNEEQKPAGWLRMLQRSRLGVTSGHVLPCLPLSGEPGVFWWAEYRIESASWPCSHSLSVALLASSSWPTTTECLPCHFPGTPTPICPPLTELTDHC